jgi:prepilin-type N-terminal cleavage/methylation domain-containing protein
MRTILQHRNQQGYTLVELLITIALVGVLVSIAFPVISNVLAGAETKANAASTQAVSNFTHEYANFNLTQNGNDIIASTDSGREIARITGTLTNNGNGGGTGSGVTITRDPLTGLLAYTVNTATCTQNLPDAAWSYTSSGGGAGLMGTTQNTTFDPTGWGPNLGYGNYINGYKVSILCNNNWTDSNTVAP